MRMLSQKAALLTVCQARKNSHKSIYSGAPVRRTVLASQLLLAKRYIV